MPRILPIILIMLGLVSCSSDAQPQASDSVQPGSDLAQQDSPESLFDRGLDQLAVITPENAGQLQELETLIGPSDSINWISFSPEGDMLAVSGNDRVVRVWELSTGIEFVSFRHGPQSGNTFSPDGAYLATAGSDKFIRIWDLETAELIHELGGHATGLVDIQYSPAGDILVTATSSGMLHFWDPASGQEFFSVRGHFDDVTGLAYHPSGTMVASASVDETIRLWDPKTGEMIQELIEHTDDVFHVEFSPDGAFLASCGGGLSLRDNTVRIWDTDSWEVLEIITGLEETVIGCSFSADGDLLITREFSGDVAVWDLESLENVLSFNVPGWFSYSIGVDPEGCLLAIGDASGEVHLYGIPD